jgi:glycosyltransferase involved in cell wall biosynthesis
LKDISKLRILFDGPFYSNPHAGIARYFNNLSRKLSNCNEVHFSRRLDCSQPKEIKLPKIRHFRPHRFSFQFEKLWFQFFNDSHFDIVHLVEYELSPTGLFFLNRGSKLVITIHDLIHEQIGAPLNLLDRNKRQNLYKNSDALIFDSYSTKNDFQKIYPDVSLNKKANSVIWLGCTFDEVAKHVKNKKHQFIFVGARNGYKNFKTALRAFERYASIHKDAKLIVVGASPSPGEVEMVLQNKERITWITNATDLELKELYKESIALLYLSRKEGFGLPLVEAMSMGCVPLAGNHSSISEVLENDGVFVDENDPIDVMSKMEELFYNMDFRGNKIHSGYERSKIFSWEKTSKEVNSLYSSLIEN